MNHRVNEVTLVGNMAMDTKWSPATEKSQSRAYFKFAVSSEKPGGSALYFDVIAWDKLADAIAANGSKGRELYIKGHLATWNGNIQVVVDNVEFWAEPKKNQTPPAPMSSSERPRASTPAPTPAPAPAPAATDDYDEDSFYVDPSLYEEEKEEVITAAPPQMQDEPQEKTPDDREELAKFLVAAGLGPEELKDMLIELTKEEMKKNRRDTF